MSVTHLKRDYVEAVAPSIRTLKSPHNKISFKSDPIFVMYLVLHLLYERSNLKPIFLQGLLNEFYN